MNSKSNDKDLDKKSKNIKIIIIVVVILLIIWFLIASPLLKFKKAEEKVREATKRYYEINNSLLPTGEKIRTVTLQKLYDKDLISEDLRSPYTSKECDSKLSWGKVRKEDNKYKYYVYLKCGILSSKVDHKGPEITLNGNDIITIEKGDKYKDLGVKSVVDDTDGNIKTSEVTIDTSKVNTNKNGTYEVTYKVRDSFNNETIKIRTVKVEQVLDKIVKKETKKTNNVYKGTNENNYIKLDGILFKIVGLNDDETVKVVSTDPLAAVDYNSVDEWLNDYFYNKLSDSAKEYIVDSKWCDEKISNPKDYTKCNSYARKKKKVGLLSVADINNSKSSDDSYNVGSLSKTWTSNPASTEKTITFGMEEKYLKESNNLNLVIYPVLNIKKDSYITTGNGNTDNPYVLKGNVNTLKTGDSISNAKSGDYISYSGYNWRVIGKEEDNTTKIIMDDVVEEYDSNYTNKTKINYSTSEKENIGYKLNNELTSNIKTTLFKKEKIETLNYNKNISYNGKIANKTYTSKLHLPNMYDLFGTSVTDTNYWYQNHSTDSNISCAMSLNKNIYCGKYNKESEFEIRVVGYLNKNVIVKNGKGTISEPYTITN